MKMLSSMQLILTCTSTLHAWSGILIDSSRSGKTQLYIPDNEPVNTPNVDFGLSHLVGQAVVMLNDSAYFIGGHMRTPGGGVYTNATTIFDPATNTSTPGAQMNVQRYLHSATVGN